MGSSVSVDLAYIFTASLLCHYESVLAKYPDHIILKRMEMCEDVNVETIKRWAKLCRTYFITQNAMYLPADELAEGMAVDAGCFSDFMQESIRIQERTAIALVEQTEALERVTDKLAVVSTRLVVLTDSVDQLNLSFAASRLTPASSLLPTDANVVDALSPHSAVVPTAVTPNPVAGRSLEDELDRAAAISLSSDTAKTFVESDVIAMKSLSLQGMFRQWYQSSVHKLQFGEISNRALDPLRLLAKVLYFMKKFLPDGTTITAPPTGEDVEAYAAWNLSIDRLSIVAERGCVAFLQTFGPILKEPYLVSVCNLRITDIVGNRKGTFPSPSVCDSATTAEFNLTTCPIKLRGKRWADGQAGPGPSHKKKKVVVNIN